MPSGATSLLWSCGREATSSSSLIRCLLRELDADRDAAWRSNLLYVAALRGADTRVLRVLLDDFYRFQGSHGAPTAAYDLRALEHESQCRPNSPSSRFLLDNVHIHKSPLWGLRALRSAAQSNSEDWALHVLHKGKGVKLHFQSVGIPDEKTGDERRRELVVAVDLVRAAIRQDMPEMLQQLLELNQQVVELAAVQWLEMTEQMDAPSGSEAATEAENLARKVAASYIKCRRWEEVKLVAMERHRVSRQPIDSQHESPNPIADLPDSLFAAIVSFI